MEVLRGEDPYLVVSSSDSVCQPLREPPGGLQQALRDAIAAVG